LVTNSNGSGLFFMSAIINLAARKVLDSRASFTIQVSLETSSGAKGVATIPSGVSAGSFEAKSLPVEEAIRNVINTISPAVGGMDVQEQQVLDDKLLELDGTKDKSKLGGNALLGVSLASARAASEEQGVPLYRYLAGLVKNATPSLPVPLFNMMEGGLHAPGGADWQEFLVIPASYWSFAKSLQAGADVYKAIKKRLLDGGRAPLLGDEGGFGSVGLSIPSVFELLSQSCRDTGLVVGKDVYFGSDVAANSFYRQRLYRLSRGEGSKNALDLERFYFGLINDFPIVYLEDVFNEEAWEDWVRFTRRVDGATLVVGDDLTVTNPERLEEAISQKAISGIIIKPNQIGTLSETLQVVSRAREAGLKIIVSHRAGEAAEDTFIADLAVAVSADYIKAGAPARGERVTKYNRLLIIEEELSPSPKKSST